MAHWHQIGDGGSNTKAKGLELIMHVLQDLKLASREAT